jgi:dienelactone hydrolase
MFWLCALVLLAFTACSSGPAKINTEDRPNGPAHRDEPEQTAFKSADGSTSLHGELEFPRGAGPFPAVVVMSPRMCEGPAGIPEGWQQATLTSWGYATLTIDNFAARGLRPAACSDFTVLQPSQTIGDAYGALEFLASSPRIDVRRIALLGFASEGMTALLSDTAEARQHYSSSSEIGFRAVFAFYPYCNIEFVHPPKVYAPERIFAGERDDLSPASRCIALAERMSAQGADIATIVYPGVEAGFDNVPPDTNSPTRDPTALHPGSTTISTHPQYDPWGENLSACTFKVGSVFDVAKRSDVDLCLRRGRHFQGDATAADDAKRDLRAALDTLVKP